MLEDIDIKIVGNKPSLDVKRYEKSKTGTDDTKAVKCGIGIGSEIADKYCDAVYGNAPGNETDNLELLAQRKTLLAFSALSGFERFCDNSECISAAKRSFLEILKKEDTELYNCATDNGALSFYYLAFRRGNDVERRIGQTFAMLCSHDGDPVYQELGEALYCWFTSEVKKVQIKFGNDD